MLSMSSSMMIIVTIPSLHLSSSLPRILSSYIPSCLFINLETLLRTPHSPSSIFSPYTSYRFIHRPPLISIVLPFNSLSLFLYSPRTSSLPSLPHSPPFLSLPHISHTSYLQEKFGIEPTDTKAKEELIKSYLEGLAWVLTYYHDGEPALHSTVCCLEAY